MKKIKNFYFKNLKKKSKKFDIMDHWKSNLKTIGYEPENSRSLFKKKILKKKEKIEIIEERERRCNLPQRSPSPQAPTELLYCSSPHQTLQKNQSNDRISFHSPDEYMLKNFVRMTKEQKLQIQIPQFVDLDSIDENREALKMLQNVKSGDNGLNFNSISSTSLYNLTKDDEEFDRHMESDLIFLENFGSSKVNLQRKGSLEEERGVIDFTKLSKEEKIYQKLEETKSEIIYLTGANNSPQIELSEIEVEGEFASRNDFKSGGSLIENFEFESNGKHEIMIRELKRKREFKIKA